MCCPLDHVTGRLRIQIHPITVDEHEGVHFHLLHVQGTFDRTPRTLADRICRIFQRLELGEKIAEIADESFHLFGSLLQSYTNASVYQTLRNLHHAAHEVEHVLHTFCFLGDVTRLLTGKFFEYQDEEFDYVRSAARVCHAIAHFLVTAAFLAEHKLCQLGRLEKACKYAPVFSALGYALWTISLIWQRHQGEENNQFVSDLSIHLGGFLFEALPVNQKMSSLAPYSNILAKVTAAAGIVHAWSIVQRLMPQDREEVAGRFFMSREDIEHPPQAHNHDHVHHEH